MSSQSPLATLIELAEKETDEAAKRLGAAIRAAEDTEKKLALLTEYRNEYAARCQNGMMAGINAMSFRNFQAFLAKMDNAVQGQSEIVRHAQRRVEELRALWQQSERKRMSYNTLSDRAQKREQKKEAKQDQKMNDEHAARQVAYKR